MGRYIRSAWLKKQTQKASKLFLEINNLLANYNRTRSESSDTIYKELDDLETEKNLSDYSC